MAELQSVRAKGRSGDIEGAKQLWLSSTLFAPVLENPRAAAALKQMVAEYSGWHWLNSQQRATSSHAADRLAELRMPILSIIGERAVSIKETNRSVHGLEVVSIDFRQPAHQAEEF